MKGSVQGYGSYEELTSSGVDPTELFDDIEDGGKSPNIVQPDSAIEGCDDTEEEGNQRDIESTDYGHSLQIEKARRHNRSKNFETNPSLTVLSNFDPLPELSEETLLPSSESAHSNLDIIGEADKVKIPTN